MVTIKSYTDILQSKKLEKILPLESADMTYFACVKDWHGNPVEPKWGEPITLTKEELALPRSNFQEYEYLPCWSLAALLSILPKNLNIGRPSLESNYKGYCWIQYYDEFMKPNNYKTECFNNSVDACYEMIIKLHELKLL